MKVKRTTSRERMAKLITLANPKSPISEAYRTLRTNIQFSSIDKTIKTIMVTSSGPSEGKSTTIANLAVTLAQMDKKVLIIDADLRKPTVHTFFFLPNRIGLTNVLAGTEPIDLAIQRTTEHNLQVLTSGPIPPNPAELLSSNKMANLVKEMAELYDYVLFDTPPVLAVTDAQLLSRYIDGVIIVVNNGKTKREMAAKAKILLENVKANVLGVVFNNKDSKQQQAYYYYE